MANDGLIKCIEGYKPEEVAVAIIHAFYNKDIEIIDGKLKEYLEDYAKVK